MRVVLACLVALALHLAAFAAVAPHLRGAEAAGAGGDALVTLSPQDAALGDLVAAWDRPPVVRAEPLRAPEPPDPPDADVASLDVPTPVTPARGPGSLAFAAVPAPLALSSPATDRIPLMESPPAPPAPAPPAPAPATTPAPAKPDRAWRENARPEAQAPAPTPAPTPTPAPSPARSAQTAAGAGGASGAGLAGAATAATSGAGSAAAMAEWGAAIRARIERRKTYPADAGGASGRVTLRLVVGADGRLVSVAVARSSGIASLDRAALRAVAAASRFAKAPKGLDGGSFTLPISFAP